MHASAISGLRLLLLGWACGGSDPDGAAAITLRPVCVPRQLLYGYYNDVQLISCTPGEVQDLRDLLNETVD